MGQLKIRFYSKGSEIGKTSYPEEDVSMEEIGLLQHLEEKYNINKMKEIEFEGKDFYIDINLDEIQNGFIDWEKKDYPNGEIKGKVLEIVYYQDILNRLKQIEQEINGVNIDNSYKLESLTRKAIKILNEEMKEPNYLPNTIAFQEMTIKYLENTLRKEVGLLNEIIKTGKSDKQKKKVLNDAQNKLIDDIRQFTFHLKNLKTN